jgi:hypothetical protein
MQHIIEPDGDVWWRSHQHRNGFKRSQFETAFEIRLCQKGKYERKFTSAPRLSHYNKVTGSHDFEQIDLTIDQHAWTTVCTSTEVTSVTVCSL